MLKSAIGLAAAAAVLTLAPGAWAQAPNAQPNNPGPFLQQQGREAYQRDGKVDALNQIYREAFKEASTAYEHGDYAVALRNWQPAADAGYAPAQYYLGLMRQRGLGGPRDDVHAAVLFRAAGNQGLAPAEYALAMLYLAGRGVKRDDAQGVKWLRRAADQGFAQAQFNLGVLYENGQGVPADAATAAAWYRKAALGGVK